MNVSTVEQFPTLLFIGNLPITSIDRKSLRSSDFPRPEQFRHHDQDSSPWRKQVGFGIHANVHQANNYRGRPP